MWKATLKRVPDVVALSRLGRILVDSGYRSQWLLRRENPQDLFQHDGYTIPDRHGPIFGFLRDQLAEIEAPKLLSFGCSTGEVLLENPAQRPFRRHHGHGGLPAWRLGPESTPAALHHLIRFEYDERHIADLVRCLKPGGYLALRFNRESLKTYPKTV